MSDRHTWEKIEVQVLLAEVEHMTFKCRTKD